VPVVRRQREDPAKFWVCNVRTSERLPVYVVGGRLTRERTGQLAMGLGITWAHLIPGKLDGPVTECKQGAGACLTTGELETRRRRWLLYVAARHDARRIGGHLTTTCNSRHLLSEPVTTEIGRGAGAAGSSARRGRHEFPRGAGSRSPVADAGVRE